MIFAKIRICYRTTTRYRTILDLLVPNMDAFNFDFGNHPEHTRPSAFEYVTRLLLPALSLVALIVTSFTIRRASVSWSLLGLTGLLLIFGFWRPISRSVRNLVGGVRCQRAARRAFPEFRHIVHGFAEFIGTQRNDTLHQIVEREAYQGRTDQFMRHGIPEVAIWSSFHRHLLQRIDQKYPSTSEFKELVSEFNDLVGLYDNNCVARVFENSPPEFRERLAPEVRRSLNSFQQRFAAFLDNYAQYGTRLTASIPSFEGLYFAFSRPRPL